MNKKIILSICLFAASSFACQMQAQSLLKNVLGSLLGGSTSSSTTTETTTSSKTSSSSSTGGLLSSIFNYVVGNKTVSSKNLVGTWTYNQPAVAFESSNLLSQAGGKVLASQVQKKLGTALTKYGFATGNSAITFNSDSTFVLQLKSKKVSGKYTTDGSTLTLYGKTTGKKLVTANVALSGSNLQITFKADKLLSFVQYASSLSTSATSSLGLLSQLAGNYSGMQLGMQFSKK